MQNIYGEIFFPLILEQGFTIFDIRSRKLHQLKTLPAFQTLAGFCFSRKGHKNFRFFKQAVNLFLNFRLLFELA